MDRRKPRHAKGTIERRSSARDLLACHVASMMTHAPHNRPEIFSSALKGKLLACKSASEGVVQMSLILQLKRR